MENKTSPPVPFEQLPLEARFMFYFTALAALARYRSIPPTEEELAPELVAAWNTLQLCEGDLYDPHRMTHLLEEYFAPSSPSSSSRGVGKRTGRLCRKASR